MDWLGDHLAGVFLGLAILLGIAEMSSLDLILLMLALGALVGMVAALLGAGFAVSAIAAAVASVACLALVRPALVKRLHSGPGALARPRQARRASRAWSPSGSPGMEPGRVKVGGEIWSAKPVRRDPGHRAGQPPWRSWKSAEPRCTSILYPASSPSQKFWPQI